MAGFEKFYIFYKFYPIKQTLLSEWIPYLEQTFNYSSQTQLHITKFVCITFYWQFYTFHELSEVIFDVIF